MEVQQKWNKRAEEESQRIIEIVLHSSGCYNLCNDYKIGFLSHHLMMERLSGCDSWNVTNVRNFPLKECSNLKNGDVLPNSKAIDLIKGLIQLEVYTYVVVPEDIVIEGIEAKDGVGHEKKAYGLLYPKWWAMREAWRLDSMFKKRVRDNHPLVTEEDRISVIDEIQWITHIIRIIEIKEENNTKSGYEDYVVLKTKMIEWARELKIDLESMF